jgi:rubrerythrin
MTVRVIYGPRFEGACAAIVNFLTKGVYLMPTKTWQCTVCGLKHDGETPPKTCSKCGVNSSKFIKIK